MDSLAPRVSCTQLQQFCGRSVRLVGRVLQAGAGFLLLETADGQQWQIQRPPGTVYTTTYVELIVQVQQGQTAGELQLHEMTCCNFGESFDLPTYERMCLVSAQHPDVC